jgi:hypothetical protein
MHAPMELLLDFVKLGSHPLADRLALHHKVLVPVLPADVRESQKIECFGFPFSSLCPVQFGKSSKLNPARLICVQFQPELSQPLLEIDPPRASQRPMQNSGPSGSLFLSREELSSSIPCRFIPAHRQLFFPIASLRRARFLISFIRRHHLAFRQDVSLHGRDSFFFRYSGIAK